MERKCSLRALGVAQVVFGIFLAERRSIMALEKIEEEFGLLAVVRDSVNFYLSYLQERKALREVAIVELADVAIQVEQMSQKKVQAEAEFAVLQQEQDLIDNEFKSIAPFVTLLSKIKAIEAEVAERQRKLRGKEEALAVYAKVAESKPDDEIIQDKLKQHQVTLRGEKISEELIIQRSSEDLIWFKQRLGDSNVNVKEVEKQAQAIQGRLQKITKTTSDKAKNLTSMDKFIQARQEKVDRLQELRADLSKLEADLVSLAEVARLVSSVPLNVQPIATEHVS